MWTGLFPSNFTADIASNTVQVMQPLSSPVALILGVILALLAVGALIGFLHK